MQVVKNSLKTHQEEMARTFRKGVRLFQPWAEKRRILLLRIHIFQQQVTIITVHVEHLAVTSLSVESTSKLPIQRLLDLC